MIPWLLPFISSNGLLVALCLGALAIFATYDSSRVQRGKELERARIEETNRKAASASDSVRAKSRSRSVRGERDPHSID